MSDLRVVIVADDPLARAGLAALLAGQAGFSVIGQIGSSETLADQVDMYRPDVVLLDLGWEPGAVLDAITDLSEGAPPLLALLPDEDQAAGVWTAGARGLLLREAVIERLAAALPAVAQGLAVLDPALASALAAPRSALPTEDLTPRELDVLRLLAEGLANKTIAHRLDISEHTVKFHINAILGKLHAQSRTEAVVNGIRLGLIAL
jgi:two-component system, NarL family, nitrate/nitrite response regulator NarL